MLIAMLMKLSPFVNSIRDSIKFDIEIGGDTLNFLDLNISINRSLGTPHLIFKIFRKPTSTDSCIPHDSLHPFSYKLAAFRALITRLFEIPMSPVHFKEELDTIYQIAVNNGYQIKTIKKLYCQILDKHVTKRYLYSTEEPVPRKQWRSLLYTGNTSYKIKKVMEKNENFNVAFYNSNKLKNVLFNHKDSIPTMEKSGIYQISVPGHGEYIGKTSRAINTRIKEHFSSVKNMHPEKSGLADYMLKNKLPTSLCQVQVLHSGHVSYKKLGLLETYHIRSAIKNGSKLFNNQIENNEGFELIM